MCISGCKVFSLKTLSRPSRMNLCVCVCVFGCCVCEHVQRGCLATDVKVIPVLFLSAQLIPSFFSFSLSSPFSPHFTLPLFLLCLSVDVLHVHLLPLPPTHSHISQFALFISTLCTFFFLNSVFFVSVSLRPTFYTSISVFSLSSQLSALQGLV